jgi:mono/diheme cytochrome c family protein
MAPPVTFELDGTQYITLLAGWGGPMGLINPPGLGPVKTGWGRLLTFALDGSAEISAAPFGYPGPPTPAIKVEASTEMIKAGGELYTKLCSACHGVNAIAAQLPDLRYATAEVHETLESFVLEGAREPLGMPSFKELLTPEQLKMIQAYVLA